MNLYVESSAVLTWLLQEPRASDVAAVLDGADTVQSSVLTLLECERATVRLAHLGQRSETETVELRHRLHRVAAYWILLEVDSVVRERAGRAFPIEPVRSLDALHLASALAARSAVADVSLLSLDDRVRAAGRSLGFEVLPT